MQCRFCNSKLDNLFVSLGSAPLSNSYLRGIDQLRRMEPYYPLDVYVCEKCFLVQLDEFESPQNIFGDYAYFSSYSNSWLDHVKKYTLKMINDFNINEKSNVIEIASNDGYLLQYFVDKGIPVLGIEPAKNVAEIAIGKKIPTDISFFGTKTAKKLVSEGKHADLLIGNNVLAHVPDLNDFVKGLKIILKPDGIITMEFPHLKNLIEKMQFDTIYHEHFSYLSLITVNEIFDYHGLTLFDVEELPTHGGSIRIYAKHKENKKNEKSASIDKLKQIEIDSGYKDINHYLPFKDRVGAIKINFLKFLIESIEDGKKIVGYGAAAKGNTLLNYCGIRNDFIDYVVDISPHKQNKFLPGSHIPIKPVDMIKETKPDYVIILPWNIKDEIIEQINYIREWDGKFVIPIPEIQII